MEELQELATKLTTVVQDYATLKRTCERQVVRWEWATFARYTPQPFYFEIMQFARGQKLKEEPKNRNGCFQYGFDEYNRVVVVRQYTEFVGQFDEEFFTYRGEVVDSVLFSHRPEKEPINVARQHLREGRLSSYAAYTRRWSLVEHYEYSGDRLVTIHVEGTSEGAPYAHDHQLNYDDSGRLQQILWVEPDGSASPIYRRPERGVTIRTLAAPVERRLVELIPEVVARAGIDEPVYCVALNYDLENDNFFPPVLGVGLESERMAWVEQYGKRVWQLIWNPAEFKHFATLALQVSDPELDENCLLLNQQLKLKGFVTPGRKLLNDVAARLMTADWQLAITPDFVVYAVDLELGNLRKNLKASVPAPRLAALKRDGYL